jgi:peroxiredoxin
MSRVNNIDEYTIQIVNNVIQQHHLTCLIFFRGWWCPACRAHLRQVESVKHILDKKDVGIVAITSQSEGNGNTLQRLLERDTNVTFPVISNPNNILAKTFLPKHSQYKLPTPDHLNKNVYDGVNFIPYSGQQPALLFIDNKGELKFCWSMKNDLPKGTGHTKETYTRGTVGDPWIRVKPDSIVQLINDIQNKKDKDSLKAETIDLLPNDFTP